MPAATPIAVPAPLRVPAPAPTGSGAVDASVVLWRALVGLGLRHAVISPGSRSAPLVYALQDAQLEDAITAHVRIDERAAAFTALGIGRTDRSRPAAAATTSGTAAAHLLAAVMEAHHSRIPLLVLTADRPAELRGTGANQTTLQPGLYADFVRYRVDVPAPSAAQAGTAELRTIAAEAARAYAAAVGPHPGPVHLNLGFRDPLVPTDRSDGTPAPKREQIAVARRVPIEPPQPAPIPVDARTVVVAGDDAGAEAARLAAAHALPLLAEPSSGARADEAPLVQHYPSLLREVMSAEKDPLRPHRAIVLGHPTLSRPVIGQLLGAEDVEVVLVDPTAAPGGWNDPSRSASLVVSAAVGEPADTTAERERALAVWKGRGSARAQDSAALPWQVRAALAVWDSTVGGQHLVLGSSSLVRDLEEHAGATAATVHANRGLAGIDGTIATAGGIALAAGARPERPVRVLLGDLTALHDLTGMLVGPLEEQPALEVIVVDDDGGRIFGGLEHREAPADVLARFFTTPHGADIAGAAGALGWHAERVTAEQLPAALARETAAVRRLLVVGPQG